MRNLILLLLVTYNSINVYADEFEDFDNVDLDGTEQEYYAATVDIDNDGVIDLRIYSEPRFTFGNSGGGFEILYRKKDGTFKRTKVFGHPLAFRIEPLSNNVRAWLYTRSNASSGHLTAYDLSTGESEKITINLNEPLGSNLHGVVISNTVSVEFNLEK